MYNSKRIIKFVVLFLPITILSACGGGGGDNNNTGSPTLPIAVAGVDQEVIANSLVKLNASNSVNTNGNATGISFKWTLQSPMASTTTVLSDPTGIAPTFTPDVGGIYTARLTITDNSATSLVDEVTVFVLTQLTNNLANDGHPYYNFDGTKIAFHSDRAAAGVADFNIWIMDENGNNLTKVTSNAARDQRPSWSPDAKQIVFHSDRDGNQNLYTINVDGSGVKVLTTNVNNDSHPVWNPTSGSMLIAYQSPRNNAQGIADLDIRLKTVSQSGSSPILQPNTNDSHPMWSTDGSKISFSRRVGNGSRDIWIMDSDGTNPVQLTNTPNLDEQHSDWSPDNSKIAYRRVAIGGTSDVWIMNSDGSNQRQLTLSTADDRNPEWHPNGTKILFRSNRTGNNELFIYPLKN